MVLVAEVAKCTLEPVALEEEEPVVAAVVEARV